MERIADICFRKVKGSAVTALVAVAALCHFTESILQTCSKNTKGTQK